ncbi:PREDICTED: PH and SEC7 domain-containing protein 4 [Galeopterus variegatus]|uniref:PH and SEC7 domain-containing protein 4 n=1 Tax=Galeopterus variegatus TaxID=482537 RepID=A0ABM0RA05_GALVR|nr:PREDICTED: PH and SEC7 domain-containing protein 4 [Galeopterus variegatus]
MEFLNVYLGDNLQPQPRVWLQETCSHPDPPEPCRKQIWVFDPPESTKQDAPLQGSGVEPTFLEDCSPQGENRQRAASPGWPGDSRPLGSPQQNQSSSAQVAFWAGILQAQMCVLDLEEELEKTEGLRAGLRCCLPTVPADLPGDAGLHPSPPMEDSGEDSSGPEGENQAWPREGTPGSSLEWGAEEESVFFNNPLFLESPCSEATASRDCLYWGIPDSQKDVKTESESPRTLEPPLPGGTVLWELGSEPDLGDHITDSSGQNTPPFPVPTYKPHSFCWTSADVSEGAPAAPPGQGEDEAPPSPKRWQTEEGSSWPQVLLMSQDRGESDAGCPQEFAPHTLVPGPWGSPASSPEPSSPESESRGPGPRPSPVSSQEGSPQLRRHSSGIFPKWTLDALHSSLLEMDGTEPSSLEKEEAGEAPNPGDEVKHEGTSLGCCLGLFTLVITNLNGLRDGGNFPKELLKALYWSIRSEKLEWAVDEVDAARPEKARPSPAAGKMSNPFLQLAQDPMVPTYKQGILARKMHQDADGKKTPWGKRGWKMFHTLLRGMVLYFLKGEDHCPEGESLVGQMVDEPVGVHHSLATPATHYTKKPHVFQLRTADWRLYLFQAPTAKEMSSWIARINLAAATHSAPPFPAAVGSQRRFVRPILPVSLAQSSLEEQHRSHENCLDAASDDLLDLQRSLPERRGRSRELEEYRLRKEYLEHEKTRYETYVHLLVARLHCPSGDLALWEEQLGREDGGAQEPKPSLKKSHSSPSLHQDEAPTTAKVKRNISERRTYRKIIPKRNRNQL